MASEQPVTNVVLHDHYYHPWMVIHVVIIKIYYLDYIIIYYYPNHPCRALGCVANFVDGTYSILDGKWMAILIISYTSRRIHTPAVQYLVVVPVVPVYNMHPNIYTGTTTR